MRRSFDEARAVHEMYGYVEPLAIRRNALKLWGSVGGDWRWARRAGTSDPLLLARSTNHHLLRLLGAILGGRSERQLPASMARSLSLEPGALKAPFRKRDPVDYPATVPAQATERLPALVAQGVGKTFRVPEQRVHTLKERALHPRRRVTYQSFRALKDISFAIEEGEPLRDRRPQRQRQEHVARSAWPGSTPPRAGSGAGAGCRP